VVVHRGHGGAQFGREVAHRHTLHADAASQLVQRFHHLGAVEFAVGRRASAVIAEILPLFESPREMLTSWTSFKSGKAAARKLRWRSTTVANEGRELAIFSRRLRHTGAPALVLVHGFPTSSIDYFALARELSSEFDIYLLDLPGTDCPTSQPSPTSIRCTTTRVCSWTR